MLQREGIRVELASRASTVSELDAEPLSVCSPCSALSAFEALDPKFARAMFQRHLPHSQLTGSRLTRSALLLLASLSLLECGAPSDPALDDAQSTGGSDGSDGSGGSGGSPTGGTSGVGGGDGGSSDIDVPNTGGGPDDLGSDEACAKGTEQATLRPVTMLILFDRSSSLIRNEVEVGVTRWDAAAAAFEAFLSDPSTDGLGVALRFFPHDLPVEGCSSPTCDIAACTQPLIDVGRLMATQGPGDAHEAALLEALAAATPVPGGGTPTGAILEGGVAWAKSYQDAHQDERVVILVVTDGAPEGCEEGIPELELFLKDALDSGISSYFVGLTGEDGAELAEDTMNDLAEAGGTEKALFIQDGAETRDELVQALASVQGSAIACDFALPAISHGGEVVDPGLVNVIYTAGGAPSGGSSTGGAPTEAQGEGTKFTKVIGQGECGDSASWFYDVEGHPSRIHLCPQACSLVSADPAASLEILLGCKPIVR